MPISIKLRAVDLIRSSLRVSFNCFDSGALTDVDILKRVLRLPKLIYRYSPLRSPIPLKTVHTPVATEATAPQVCVSGDTGNFNTPIAKATLAIDKDAPWAI